MSLRRSVLSVPLLALALCAAILPAAGPAVAAPSTAAPEPARHCLLAAGAAAPTCFATFPEAISAVTKGSVRAPASAAAATADPLFDAALTAAGTGSGSYVVGIEYTSAGYTGSSLTLYASGRCDYSLDADYVFNTLPGGWNDVITSFKSYNNCAQQLFRNTYRGGGAITGILTSTTNVGAAANDQASSITAN